MRHNWLECTSASGGTGDLALIAGANGFPMLSAPWSGVRQVRYSILEYNSNPSSTNAILLRAEDGYCPLDVSGPTLKRSDAAGVIFSSWDGTNLYPKMGSGTAASKQSFSANSGNIRIICSAAAEDNIFLSPVIAAPVGALATYGQSPFAIPSTSNVRIFSAAAAGQITYWPFFWPSFGLYSKISAYVGITTGSISGLYAAIYEVSKTGLPGRLLANFGNLGTPAGSILTSSALSPPIFLDPGQYWLAFLPTTGSTGTINFSALAMFSSSVEGATIDGGNPGTFGYTTTSGQVPPLSDPAVTPTGLQISVEALMPWFGLQ